MMPHKTFHFYHLNSLIDNCVAKELTLLANTCNSELLGITTSLLERPLDDFLYANTHLCWLQLLLKQAMAIDGKVGIFGTSISATWLADALGSRVDFFVDEDPNRIGRIHLECPIFAIEQAPIDLPVLMPMRRDIAQAIKQRLGSIHPNMITPPKGDD